MAVGLAAVFLALRFRLALTPALAETYYDEALTGLMGLAILRGVPQVFYWGEPYGGAIGDAYLAAAGFWLFGPSTLVLRMSAVLVTALWAVALWSIARRITGEGFGLLAGLLVAVPPVFLSFVQLSSQGESVAMALGTVGLAAAARLVDSGASPRGRAAAWALLGLAGGLGWWAGQIMGMLLIAAAMGIVVTRPRVLRERGAYVALGLFILASLPFWIWNVRHEWATFRHLATWGDALPDFGARLSNATGTLLATIEGRFWDGRAVVLSPAARLVARVVVVAVYLPSVGLAGVRLGVWGARLARRQRPWQEPLDLVVLAFWLTAAAHLATWFGSSGILRYSMTFYATLPVLCAVLLARVARLGRVGRVGAVALGALLLGYNALTHVLFLKQVEGLPYRAVDAVIARLDALGIRACYADSRVAQVITFESAERITCADLNGFRNFSILQSVDAVEDPATVAVIAHRVLKAPAPDVVADTLRFIGTAFRQDEVGDYVIFHHWQPPDDRIRPIARDGWAARASARSEAASLAFDRQVWTAWRGPKTDQAWFELDLGRVYPLAQLTAALGPLASDVPLGLRVETSPDGRVWDRAAAAPDLIAGTHWWKGHPRVDDSGRVIVRMVPRPVRYVRLVETGTGEAGSLWSISEIFAYQLADAAWEPPGPARAAHAEAARALGHWMDDPAGPHPKRAPVTTEHRRRQVPWATVFDAADRTLALAPEWEEAHYLYGRALALWGWSEAADVAVARARADGAWREVVRWAERAAASQPQLWRSGRDEARAEALERLGRPAEAASVRADSTRVEAEQRLRWPVRARFGSSLELTGVDIPEEVRPGERVIARYAWRALRPMRQDYTAFVHIRGPARQIDHDHLLGADYGTSRWAAGERTWEALPLVVPRDTPPGSYPVIVGVWFPPTAQRLSVTETDLPRGRHVVTVGTVTVVPGDAGPDRGLTLTRSQ